MTKRLCDLVEMIENNKNCVVLAVKEGVEPLDLIQLGGFSGQETMFRMGKDPDTVGITVFRKDGSSHTMNIGSSNTVVSGDLRQVRNQIRECVNLYFGVFTLGDKGRFDQSVEATLGMRDLDSPKHFELQRGRDRYSLFVNDQHIALESPENFESWLEDHGMALEITSTRSSGLATVDFGEIKRVETVEVAREGKQAEVADREPFSALIDQAFDKFLGKTGWQGLDAPSIVAEFVRFAKMDFEPSLDSLMAKAKEKTGEKVAKTPAHAKHQRPSRHER